MISAEAPVVFAQACELFIMELTSRAWAITEENKRRTLQVRVNATQCFQTRDVAATPYLQILPCPLLNCLRSCEPRTCCIAIQMYLNRDSLLIGFLNELLPDWFTCIHHLGVDFCDFCLQKSDVAQAIQQGDFYDFLVDIIPPDSSRMPGSKVHFTRIILDCLIE